VRMGASLRPRRNRYLVAHVGWIPIRATVQTGPVCPWLAPARSSKSIQAGSVAFAEPVQPNLQRRLGLAQKHGAEFTFDKWSFRR